ncbi:hypothetical protein DIPPA_55518 [Diplonema papillatum]|nr:hypothetical protein DIPPA_55518 [Diplonema papillatum]
MACFTSPSVLKVVRVFEDSGALYYTVGKSKRRGPVLRGVYDGNGHIEMTVLDKDNRKVTKSVTLPEPVVQRQHVLSVLAALVHDLPSVENNFLDSAAELQLQNPTSNTTAPGIAVNDSVVQQPQHEHTVSSPQMMRVGNDVSDVFPFSPDEKINPFSFGARPFAYQREASPQPTTATIHDLRSQSPMHAPALSTFGSPIILQAGPAKVDRPVAFVTQSAERPTERIDLTDASSCASEGLSYVATFDTSAAHEREKSKRSGQDLIRKLADARRELRLTRDERDALHSRVTDLEKRLPRNLVEVPAEAICPGCSGTEFCELWCPSKWHNPQATLRPPDDYLVYDAVMCPKSVKLTSEDRTAFLVADGNADVFTGGVIGRGTYSFEAELEVCNSGRISVGVSYDGNTIEVRSDGKVFVNGAIHKVFDESCSRLLSDSVSGILPPDRPPSLPPGSRIAVHINMRDTRTVKFYVNNKAVTDHIDIDTINAEYLRPFVRLISKGDRVRLVGTGTRPDEIHALQQLLATKELELHQLAESQNRFKGVLTEAVDKAKDRDAHIDKLTAAVATAQAKAAQAISACDAAAAERKRLEHELQEAELRNSQIVRDTKKIFERQEEAGKAKLQDALRRVASDNDETKNLMATIRDTESRENYLKRTLTQLEAAHADETSVLSTRLKQLQKAFDDSQALAVRHTRQIEEAERLAEQHAKLQQTFAKQARTLHDTQELLLAQERQSRDDHRRLSAAEEEASRSSGLFEKEQTLEHRRLRSDLDQRTRELAELQRENARLSSTLELAVKDRGAMTLSMYETASRSTDMEEKASRNERKLVSLRQKCQRATEKARVYSASARSIGTQTYKPFAPPTARQHVLTQLHRVRTLGRAWRKLSELRYIAPRRETAIQRVAFSVPGLVLPASRDVFRASTAQCAPASCQFSARTLDPALPHPLVSGAGNDDTERKKAALKRSEAALQKVLDELLPVD